MFFKLAILSIFLVFSQVSFSQSSCYDVAIKNVIERYEDDQSVIYVQFDGEISSDSDITTTWFINYCID